MLRSLRESNYVKALLFDLRGDLVRNAGNLTDFRVYRGRWTTPREISAYTAEVIRCLTYLHDYQGPEISVEDKHEFFGETRHAFGRSALVLSGGGSLGQFHVGVLKGLFELQVRAILVASMLILA
jgi:TAG lipase / steryl ester hydrolase / phospholipase A2 / LPA acyltransferase